MGHFNLVAEFNKRVEKEINKIHEKTREDIRKYESENRIDLFQELSDSLNPVHAKEVQRDIEDKCNMPHGALNPTRKEDVIL